MISTWCIIHWNFIHIDQWGSKKTTMTSAVKCTNRVKLGAFPTWPALWSWLLRPRPIWAQRDRSNLVHCMVNLNSIPNQFYQLVELCTNQPYSSSCCPRSVKVPVYVEHCPSPARFTSDRGTAPVIHLHTNILNHLSASLGTSKLACFHRLSTYHSIYSVFFVLVLFWFRREFMLHSNDDRKPKYVLVNNIFYPHEFKIFRCYCSTDYCFSCIPFD